MLHVRLAATVLVATVLGCTRSPSVERPQRLVELPRVTTVGDSAEPACVAALSEDRRRCIAATMPSRVKFRLTLPERPELSFAVGIRAGRGRDGADATAAARSGAGRDKARFIVRAGSEEPLDEVFVREIHPARQGAWLEQRVDLDGYAGQTIWLSFETESSLEAGGAGNYSALFAEPIVHARSGRRAGRAVVLVSIDTLRRDHVSVYEPSRRTTPVLERLAEEGIVYEDAVSTSSWTLPAHASLLTSLYPSAHGGTRVDRGVREGLEALPGLLRDAGYFTQALVTQIYLSDEYGLGAGFDALHWMQEARAGLVTDRAIDFLATHHGDDFFLFLHYFDPHFHYEPPAPFDREFDPDYDGPATGNYWEFRELAGALAPRDLDHIRALYDGEVRYVDRELGRFFDEMKRLGIYEDATIVVTSDHGEQFLEHGRFGHPSELYEELLRVPLILRRPGAEGGGQRVDRQVSLIDVAPTLLGLLELPVPSRFHGITLLGEPREPRSIVWSEVGAPARTPPYQVAARAGARGAKLIFREENGVVWFYQLSDDPAETVDLSDDHAETVARARERLESFLERMAREDAAGTEVDISPEHRERLRALGYIQ